jgi:hypothetical protein
MHRSMTGLVEESALRALATMPKDALHLQPKTRTERRGRELKKKKKKKKKRALAMAMAMALALIGIGTNASLIRPSTPPPVVRVRNCYMAESTAWLVLSGIRGVRPGNNVLYV